MDNSKQDRRDVKKKAKKVVKKQLVKAGFGSEGGLRSFLMKHSAFMNTILDPYSYPGVKIPDNNLVASGTTQCFQRFQVVANAGFLAGAYVYWGQTLTTGSIDIFTSAAGSLLSNLTWTGADKVYDASLQTIAARQRLVSAVLMAFHEGATQTDQGRCSVISSPAAPFTAGPPLNPAGATYANLIASTPYVSTMPAKVTTRSPARVRYLPLDPTSWAYTIKGVPTVGASTNNGSQGLGLILFDGLTVGTVVEFLLIENFEFIPVNNTISLIQPSPSKSDPMDLSLTLNEIAKDPFESVRPMPSQSGPTAPTLVGGAAKATDAHPLQEKTLMEKILGGIDKGIDVVGKGIQVGKSALPVIESLMALV